MGEIFRESVGNDITVSGYVFFIKMITLILLMWAIKTVIFKIICRNIKDTKVIYTVRKLFSYIITILTGLLLVYAYIRYYKYVGTLLGLFSAGLAISLKDPISNLAGWFFVISRRPFEVGDRMKIGKFSGDVIDIRLFEFTLMEIGDWVEGEQSTGRIIHVPNGKVLVQEVINYSKGFQFIWDEISVLITFESDWKKAKYILTQIITRHTEHLAKRAEKHIKEANKNYKIAQFKHLTPIVYIKVEDSGVKLTMRYLSEPRKRRVIENLLWEEILEKFEENKEIQLAYPTMRIYKRDFNE